MSQRAIPVPANIDIPSPVDTLVSHDVEVLNTLAFPAAATQPREPRYPARPIRHAQPTHPKRGRLQGVIIPTLEFAWSVVIFIRFGFIVGRAGVVVGMSLVLFCAATVALTHCAIAAAASNEMPRGGVTSVLSRALGSGIGGGIAVLYYLGVSSFQTIEIYGSTVGLQEVIAKRFMGSELLERVAISGGLLLICFLLVFSGPKVYHRLSVLFMVCLVVAFSSCFIGLLVTRSDANPNLPGHITGIMLQNLRDNLWPSHDFQLKDALSSLMPCFVGIYVGTNNAAELRDPLNDIPKGGFIAIGTTTLLYLLLFVLIGSVGSRERLLADALVLARVAWPSPILATIGIVFVGLGSSMQCLIIASRVLMSLFLADLLPNYIIHTQAEHTHFGAGLQSLLYYIALNHLHLREEEEQQRNVKAILALYPTSLGPRPEGASIRSTPAPRTGVAKELLHSDVLRDQPLAMAIERVLRSELVAEGIWRPQVLAFVAFRSEASPRTVVVEDELIAATTSSAGSTEEVIEFRPTERRVQGFDVVPEPRARALISLLGQLRSGSARGGGFCIVASIVTPADEAKALEGAPSGPEVEGAELMNSFEGESLVMQSVGLGDFAPNTVCALWPQPLNEDEGSERGDEQFINIRWTSLIIGQNSIFLKIGPEGFPGCDQSMSGSRGLEEAPMLRSEISAKLRLLRVKVDSIQVLVVDEHHFSAATNRPYGVQNEQILMSVLVGEEESPEKVIESSPFFSKLKEEIAHYSTGPVTDLVMIDYPTSEAWLVDSFERTMGSLLYRFLNSLCQQLDRVALVGTGSKFKTFYHSYTYLEEPFVTGRLGTSKLVTSAMSLLSVADTLLAGQPSHQDFLVSNQLVGSFPHVAQRLNLGYYAQQGTPSVPQDYFKRVSHLNQLSSMALQLRNDIHLTNHKYMAHQLALLYQAINLVGGAFTKYHARIQAEFESVKSLTSDPNVEEPQLTDAQKQWLNALTTDILNELLFSDVKGLLMPAHLSSFLQNGPVRAA
ncbi:Protein ccc1 [Phlyctochytrium bullatum]|nr:Protein ccc1 [Phlyctochytrium bullatum]